MGKTGGLEGYIVDISVMETEGWINKRFETESGEPIMTALKLPVRQMLIDCLFHGNRQVSHAHGGILSRRIADRILDEKSDKMTLNQDEWKHLKDAVSAYPEFLHHEFSVIDRVLDAKETSLKPEK